jgi:uncharacterized protein YlaI
VDFHHLGANMARKCNAKTRRGNSYADQAAAQVAANRMNGKRRAAKVRRNPIEPYLCQLCSRWHLGKSRLTRQWEAANKSKREG